MRKILILLTILTTFSLTACTHILKPYRPPVQQGNVLTPEMTQKVKLGMTKMQVVDVLGGPVLINPFDNNTWNYVYTFKPSKGPLQKKQLTITFRNDRVSHIEMNLPEPKLHQKK